MTLCAPAGRTTILSAMRNLLVVLLLVAIACSAAIANACSGGGDLPADTPTEESEATDEIDEELRDFVATLVLTRDDMPDPVVRPLDEEWQTDPLDQQFPQAEGFNTATVGWSGTYSRPFLLEGEDGETYTVANAGMAFTGSGGPLASIAAARTIDRRALGLEFVLGSSATAYEIVDVTVDVGEDAYALVYTGAVPGESVELLSAQVMFARGPVLGIIGIVGFVELDEELLAELARLLDERIEAGLAEPGNPFS